MGNILNKPKKKIKIKVECQTDNFIIVKYSHPGPFYLSSSFLLHCSDKKKKKKLFLLCLSVAFDKRHIYRNYCVEIQM